MDNQVLRIPTDAAHLADVQLRRLCQAVSGEHAAKKRYTAIRYGIARATPGVTIESVFAEDADDAELICHRSIWFGKWRNLVSLRRIWEYVETLVLDHREQETLAVELEAQQVMRQAIAAGATDAVQGLRVTALNREDRADFRTDASKALITLFDEALGARLQESAGAVPVTVENLDDLIELELARVGEVSPSE